MNVDYEIKCLLRRMREEAGRIRWLREHRKDLESLPEANFCSDRLDFDFLPHAEVIRVIRTLGGKWKKTQNQNAVPPPDCKREQGQAIDYERDMGPVTVRCWAGEPPPSCRIVEVEEVIPAHTLPAVPERHIPEVRKKVRKMICTGKDEPLLVEMSRKLSPINGGQQ